MGQNLTMADTSGALEQRGPLGVVDGPVLGDRFTQDKDDDDLEDRGRGNAPGPEPLRGQQADQGGHHQLADQHEQQDGVEKALRVLGQPDQVLGSPATLVHHGHGLGLARPDQAGLGQGQHGRGGKEHDHDDDQDRVDTGELRRGQQRSAHSALNGALTMGSLGSLCSLASQRSHEAMR